MPKTLLLLISLLLIGSFAQAQLTLETGGAYKRKIRKARKKKNKKFKRNIDSPLSKVAQQKFRKLSYFPINPDYQVKARVELTPGTVFFEMVTSNGQKKHYRPYAILHFVLKGKKFSLPIYQSHQLMRIPTYRNYRFVPFTDLSNGNTTYGAGRYIELYIKNPQATEVILDFNTAYNPYCAYSPNYSCPIPPKANHLNMRIEAGEKKFEKH